MAANQQVTMAHRLFGASCLHTPAAQAMDDLAMAPILPESQDVTDHPNGQLKAARDVARIS